MLPKRNLILTKKFKYILKVNNRMIPTDCSVDASTLQSVDDPMPLRSSRDCSVEEIAP